MTVDKLLQSKDLLYIVLFVSIMNIVVYLQANNFNAILLFVAVGYLSTYFTKNMIINLALPIIVTSLL